MNSNSNDYSIEFLRMFEAYIHAVDKTAMKEASEHAKSNTKEKLKSLEDAFNRDLDGSKKSSVAAEHEFKRLIETLVKIDRDLMPYSKITGTLFNSSDNEEFIELIMINIEQNWKQNLSENTTDDLKKKYFKLKEHISLSVIQRTHISKSLKEEVHSVKQQMIGLQDEIKHYKRSIKEVKDDAQSKINGMITQFIAILGIFSAVLMGSFGAIHGFTSLFNSAHRLSIGHVILISSLGCLTVLFILFFLMHTLGKLIDKSISSCNCYRKRVKPRRRGLIGSVMDAITTNTDQDTYCNCSAVEKYPMLVYVTYFLTIMAMAGFIIMIWTSNDQVMDYLQTSYGPFAATATIVMTVGLFMAFVHKKFLTKSRKDMSVEE